MSMKYEWSIISDANYTNLCDSSGSTRTLAGDSCVVHFRWNDDAKKYIGIYPKGNLTALDLPTYYQSGGDGLSSYFLFIRLHYPRLKRLLRDPDMRSTILYFLDQLRGSGI